LVAGAVSGTITELHPVFWKDTSSFADADRSVWKTAATPASGDTPALRQAEASSPGASSFHLVFPLFVSSTGTERSSAERTGRAGGCDKSTSRSMLEVVANGTGTSRTATPVRAQQTLELRHPTRSVPK
jgi:hypothetical protein